jgi:hypothetical protein
MSEATNTAAAGGYRERLSRRAKTLREEELTSTQLRLVRLTDRYGAITVLPGHKGGVGGKVFSDATLCNLILNDVITSLGKEHYVLTDLGRAVASERTASHVR